MVKFLFWILGTMGSMTLIWIALIFFQTDHRTLSSQWIADVYEMKIVAAQKIQGKKIVIVAGSGALFGIDSKIIEEAYKIPVVNFGVNAGLLLPYVLLKSKSILKRGDIVIMPLEYNFYTYDGVPNTQMIDQIFSRDPSFFWKLSLKEQWGMVLMTPLSRVIDGYLAQGGEKAMCGPYGYRNLDGRGDQLHTSAMEANQWAYDWDALKKELPRRYGMDIDNTVGWQWLTQYAKWAKENGICLIVIPPSMMKDIAYYDNLIERRFYQGLRAKVEDSGITYVGNPYSVMYDRKMYFNTDYHLNETGRGRWTRQIIEDLGPDLSSLCQ